MFLYRNTIDGRWGMDRLFALVDSELHLDPRSGIAAWRKWPIMTEAAAACSTSASKMASRLDNLLPWKWQAAPPNEIDRIKKYVRYDETLLA